VFRWLSWEEPPKGPKGWGRRIGYTLSEYRQLDRLVGDFVKRLDVKAIEVEMVGYVLGKEEIDVDTPISKDTSKKEDVKKSGAGVKRKGQTQDTDNTSRKSKRQASSNS
jgi:hypothetical protein